MPSNIGQTSTILYRNASKLHYPNKHLKEGHDRLVVLECFLMQSLNKQKKTKTKNAQLTLSTSNIELSQNKKNTLYPIISLHTH